MWRSTYKTYIWENHELENCCANLAEIWIAPLRDRRL